MNEILTNNNAAGEIRQAGMDGLTTRRITADSGIDFARINSGMRDQDFTLNELVSLTTCLKRFYRDLKNAQKRAC